MALRDKVWDTLVAAVRGGRRKSKSRGRRTLEKLIAIRRRGKAKKLTERLEPSSILMERAEILYRLDPLLFSGINKLVRRIACTRLYFSGGDETEIEELMQLVERLRLRVLLPHLVKDAFIYGFGVAEIVYDKQGLPESLVQLYPKFFDYIREGNDIARDAEGNIQGFIYKPGYAEETEYKPEEVLLIRFYTLGEDCLGISPVEAAFKASWIRLNIEEAVGEAVFRHGFPLYYFKIGSEEPGSPYFDVTPQDIEDAKKLLKDFDTATELYLPWWIEPGVIKGGDVGGIRDLLEYFAGLTLTALELPKAFGVQTTGLGGRAVEEMDFEKTVTAMQESLASQLMEQIFLPYMEKRGFQTRPQLRFVEYSPEQQMARARRLSVYSKYDLIKRDTTLENEIRRMEGLSPKKRKREDIDDTRCVFGLGTCPIREEEDIPLDRLSAFCNVCVFRIRAINELKKKKKKGREA